MTPIFTGVLLVVHVTICLLLCLVVLMQRPKQEGLGAAFGGGMTDQAFGARTTDVLQKGTVFLGTLLFIVTLTLSVLISSSGIEKREDAKATTNTEQQISNAGSDLDPNPNTPEADTEKSDADEINERMKKESGETPDEKDKAETPAKENDTPVDPTTPDPATPNPTTPGDDKEKKEATGAIIGAAAGAIIGHQSGKAIEGAKLGGIIGHQSGKAIEGAKLGGIIGNQSGKEPKTEEPKTEEPETPAEDPQP